MSAKKAWILVLMVSMVVLPLPALAVPNIQAGDPTIYVLPISIHPGGHVRVSGHSFSAGNTYYVHLLKDGIPTQPFNEWIPVMADGNGQFRTTLPLSPTLEAGGGYLVAATTHPIIEPGVYAYAPLTILPAITLSLNPTSGPPGTVVQFTAGNLTPGSLRLDYAGAPVLGPLPVSETSYSGSFVVPGDRPTPLGSMTTVKVVNLVSGSVVGTAEANYQSQPGSTPPTYILTNVVLPGEPVLPGESFNISGMISPPPQGALAGYNVVAMWRSDGGQAFPISEGPANIQANGQFQLPAHIPSPLWGDPQTSSQLNEIGLALLTPTGAGSPSYDMVPASSFLDIMVLVRDIDTGEPVEGAWVDVEFVGWDGGNLSPGLSEAGPDSVADIHGEDGFNQVNDLAFDQDEWWQQMQCDGKTTDDSGYLEAKLQPEIPIIDVMMGADEWRAMYNAAPGITAGQAGASPARSARAGAWVPPGSGWLHYKILVDGGEVCYGLPGAGGSAQQDIYEKTVWFSKSSGELRDEDGNLLSIPYGVYLRKIPSSLCGEGILVGMNLGSARGEKACSEGGGLCPRWAGLVSFAPVQGQVSLAGLHDLQVYFSLKTEDATELKDPKLYLDGVPKGDFEKENYTINGEKYCEPDEADIDMVKFIFTFPVNEYAYWTAAEHELKIEWKHGQETVFRYVLLDIEDLPDWFRDERYQDRKASHTFRGLVLEGQLPDAGEPLSADIPNVGLQENKAEANSTRRETIHGIGYSTQFLEARMNSQALNNPGPEQTVEGNTAGPTTVWLDTASHTIVNTGWKPVFRSVWGLWPVASAELGCNMWFRADVQTGGALVFDNNRVESHLCVYPYATISVDTYFNMSAILGVAKGEVHAVPNIRMGMPIHIQDGSVTGNGSGWPSQQYCGFTWDMCFAYQLDVSFYTRLGWCPVCKEKEGAKNLFAGSEPEGCTVPSVSTSGQLASSGATPPLHANPAIATDGFGNIQAVYVDESNGGLVSSSYDGLQWTGVNTLTTNLSAYAPKIAFIKPEQVVAVWTESTLSTLGDWASTTFSDSINTTHVVYATFDGSEWSDPADLTTPSGGEGNVALAGCLSTDPTCPNGGEVTAVWVRRVGGDQPDWRFRLYYSTYHDGAWSVPQEVDPQMSGASDNQPNVVYSNGQPLVAWIRDGDTRLDTLADHRIATRLLDGTSSTVIPTGLLDSIIEFSLAVDGDGDPRLAFTRAEDNGGLVDSRHNLYSGARNGSVWSHYKLLDTYDRPIRAEGPVLTLDKNDQGTITFRGLGFGATPKGEFLIANGETVGMVTGAGELAQLEVSFDLTAHDPHYLTGDGATYWESAATFDPVGNSIVAMAVQGTPVSSGVYQQLQVAPRGNRVQAVANGSSVVFAHTPRVPNYVVAALAPSDRYPQPGDTITVDVQLRNDGIASAAPVTITATWDGGPGIGARAGESKLSTMAAGQPLTLTLDLDEPLSGYDLPHELVVTINYEQRYSELDVSDNSLSTTVGGLPVPSDVTASAKKGSPIVFLQWTDLNDPRIAGYRVYRATGGAAPVPVGSTFVPGFVDLTAEMDNTYHYTVVSFTEDGIESESGNVVDVTLAPWRSYLPLLRRGFR